MAIPFHYPAPSNDKQFQLLQLAESTVIPRVIHQTFMTKNLPLELQGNVENLKRLNPGWKHMIHDDDDIVKFITENYGLSIVNYYKRINPRYGAARADLFRYLLMYKCGGVYLDIKSTCSRPLDEVLLPTDRYILSHWRNKPEEVHAGFGMSKEVAHVTGGEYQQWHIIAARATRSLKRRWKQYSPISISTVRGCMGRAASGY